MTDKDQGQPALVWGREHRERVWAELGREWDIIVIGGGITGAGIIREAAHAGLRVLLVDADDFSAGTSSRSGKMVHGGLRYLQSGQIRLTIQSVAERERLLREGRGLISPQSFLLPSYRGDRPPMWVFGVGLSVYDMLAMKWGHRHYTPSGLRELCPQLDEMGLVGGFRFFDAQTDDARLVLRLLREATLAGGLVLNYARAEQLVRSSAGTVRGIALRDTSPDGRGRSAEVIGRVVINATGAWADELRGQLGYGPRLRALRGGHLVFPLSRLPLTRGVTFLHPADHRPLYVLPWEGVVLAGTTDVDHKNPIEIDPAISTREIAYLLEALQRRFPSARLCETDILSTFAGVRPVVNTGKADPSKESREFVLWDEGGLLTVTGGKLTTFRLMAHDALRAVRPRLTGKTTSGRRDRVLDALPVDGALPVELSPQSRLRLLGRYGRETFELVGAARSAELEPIPPSDTLWAEIRWAARAEGVVHLDDLLLRRVRVGITLPHGGIDLMDRVREIAQTELGWNDARWGAEVAAYARLWAGSYSLPERDIHETPTPIQGARSPENRLRMPPSSPQ